MSTIIQQAIAQKRRLKLYYVGYIRIVEPYAYGLDYEGQSLLLCFQDEMPGSTHRTNNWCCVRAQELVSIKMLDESFDRFQSGYIRNHPVFKTVLIQV